MCTTASKYARKHSPWVNFPNVPASANMPMTSWPSDFSQLPTVSFVIPNLNNDMHDGTIAAGDTWLRNNLDAYVQWARTHNSLFVLTWDEDDYTAGNQIGTVLVGERVHPGIYSEPINHYNLLRTIQDAYGLDPLGQSATVGPIMNIWNDGTGNLNPSAVFSADVFGLTASLDASGSTDPDGTITNYAWAFGDGTTSSGTAPTIDHTYPAAATYQVSLTVTDNNGATRTITQPVTAGTTQVLAADQFSRTTTTGWGTADTGGAWTFSGTRPHPRSPAEPVS